MWPMAPFRCVLPLEFCLAVSQGGHAAPLCRLTQCTTHTVNGPQYRSQPHCRSATLYNPHCMLPHTKLSKGSHRSLLALGKNPPNRWLCQQLPGS